MKMLACALLSFAVLAPHAVADGTDAAPGLSRKDAEAAVKASLRAIEKDQRTVRQAELESGTLSAGGASMRIWAAEFGKSKQKRPLWISMHGGGGAPARVNDQQWENQKRLYRPAEGVYVAPRAPTNEWNLWHQGHVDDLFQRLVENLVMCRGVDPDRVYLMGYSAGGDGVYQLAPRMADCFAAAAMMAGHPNETKPDGLRNLPFNLQVGALDGAFDRNAIATRWGTMLDELAKADPGAYVHEVKVRAGKGHWMDGLDADALPWMAKYRRDPRPAKVVWLQDDVTHRRFYWLAVDRPQAGQRIVAERSGQEVRIVEAPAGTELRVRLDDAMLDLDRDVRVTHAGKALFEGRVPRLRATIDRVLAERYDPSAAFTAEVTVRVP